MTRTESQPADEAASRLGAYVQRLRKERNLSMRALATLAKVDFSYVSRLEHGQVGAPAARQLWRSPAPWTSRWPTSTPKQVSATPTGLPGFAPYLRAKYDLPDEAIAQLQAHFELINEKYHPTDDPRNGRGGYA